MVLLEMDKNPVAFMGCVEWAPVSQEPLAPGQMDREGVSWWEVDLSA